MLPSCLFIVPFYTSKLQISSSGHNMSLKHVHGLAAVNILHSSPPGTVFLMKKTSGLKKLFGLKQPWYSPQALAVHFPLLPLCLHHPCLTHQQQARGGQQTGRGHGHDRCPELAKGVFHTPEQCSAIKAAVLGAERGGGGCSEIVWGSVSFWEPAMDSQFVACFPPPPFLHQFHCLSWSTRLFQFPI